MTWRDEARGLPVWEGALFYDDDSEHKRVYFHGDERGGRPQDCTPALDNPDVFAAFLRRLAIRLGCPEEVANGGVLASISYNYGNPYFCLAAGWNEPERGSAWASWTRMRATDTRDRILAAVRAWKGVQS